MSWKTALPLLLILAGCSAAMPWARRDGDPRRTATALKLVKEKRPLTTLVARDGTTCAVTPDRFHRIHEGDAVWCAWSSEGDRLNGRRSALAPLHPAGAAPRRPATPLTRPSAPPGPGSR